MNIKIILLFSLFKTFFSYLLSTSTPDLKLCINCKYFIESHFNQKFGKCDKYSLVDKVSGEKLFVYACMARNAPHLCGKDAEGYEDKNKNEDDQKKLPASNNDILGY
jgi:hypothetical protein